MEVEAEMEEAYCFSVNPGSHERRTLKRKRKLDGNKDAKNERFVFFVDSSVSFVLP